MTEVQLQSFLPLRLIGALESDGGTELECDAALMFADISGFTTVSTRLVARSGAEGADALSRVIHECLALLLPVVEAAGAEVVKFAGDGILAVFRGDDAARAAAGCGLAMVRTAEALPTVEGVRLGLKTATTCGRLRVVRVGGDEGAWDFLIAGPAVQQLAPAFAVVQTGQATISAEAERLAMATVEPLGSSFRIVDAEFVRTAVPMLPVDPALFARWTTPLLRAQARQPLDAWSAELRALSVMFVSFPDVDPAVAAVEDLSAAVRICQEELRVHGGVHDGVAVDEKGLVFTGAFGMAGRRAERTADAAIHAGMALRARLAAMGVETRIGIATGRVFVGPVGTDWRRQIALLGAPMNLAARLAFLGVAGVLIDETTRTLSRDATTEALAITPLKGFAEPQPRHRVTDVRRRRSNDASGAVLGRDETVRVMDAAVARLDSGEGSTLVFEGPAGIGKSRLCAHVVARARSGGLAVLEMFGDPAARDRPWSVIRPLMEAALGVLPRAPTAERTAAVVEGARRVGRLGLAPLLGAVVGLELADTRESAALSGGGRADATASMVAELLAPPAGRALVVVDDTQWMDHASAQALVALRERVAAVMVVLSVRLGPERPPEELTALRDAGEVIPLSPLSDEVVGQLIADRLGTAEVPASLASWVTERAGGNPFYIRELAAAMIASGAAFDPQRAQEVQALPNLDAAIARQLDVLDHGAQLTAKAASVIGMRFELDLLEAIHPLGAQTARDGLAALTDAGVMLEGEGGAWSFNHRITRDVVYGALLHGQRHALHADAVRWLQAQENRVPARLAWHHEGADQIEDAVGALGEAWVEADRAGAFVDARSIAQRALALRERLPADPVAQAAWWRRLAEHAAHLGQFPTALSDAERGLDAVGRRLPVTPEKWRKRFFAELGTQLWHRFGARLPPRAVADPLARELAHLHVRAAEGLTFARGDRIYALITFLASINLCERAGIPGVAANAWGVVGVALTALGMHRAGGFYIRTAVRSAAATGEERLIATAAFHEATALAVLGRWDESEAIYRRCATGCETSGNHFLLNFVWAASLLNNFTRGAFAEVEAAAERLEAVAERTRQIRGQAVAAYVRGFTALYRGRAEAAAEVCRVARDQLVGIDDISWTNAAAGLAQALQALGRDDEAVAEVERIMDALAGARPPDSRRLEAFAGPAEVLVSVALRGRAHPRMDEALTLLSRSARTFGVGTARLALMRGLAARSRGDRRSALRQLDKAVAAAETWGLRHEAARARLARAAAAGQDDPASRAWFASAGLPHFLEAPGLAPWSTR